MIEHQLDRNQLDRLNASDAPTGKPIRADSLQLPPTITVPVDLSPYLAECDAR